MENLKKFWHHNSLSIVIFLLFILFLAGQSVAGMWHENEQLAEHGQPQLSYGSYLTSGEFIESVFENWESEFLQMWALVILTIALRQRGSADSKKLRGKMAVDTSSRYSIIRASSWKTRKKALWHALYSHSLGLALLGMFVVSFALHALGGTQAYNNEAQLHNGEQVTVWAYALTPTFWFESFQNWQSEFLAVGMLLVLSIFLRERGSPESKPVEAPNSQTGE